MKQEFYTIYMCHLGTQNGMVVPKTGTKLASQELNI